MATAIKKAPAKKKTGTGTRASKSSTRTKKAGTKTKAVTRVLKAPKPPKAPKKITSKTTDKECMRIVDVYSGRVGTFMRKRAVYRLKIEQKKAKRLAKGNS